MIRVTKQQRANAIEARDVMWPSVPPENVMRNLKMWRFRGDCDQPTCGTVACFGGWCAWWPSFRAQEVTADEIGAPMLPSAWGPLVVSYKLFGKAEMFLARGEALADDTAPKGCTDHKLVTHRLNWLIANSEVIE